MCPTFFSPRQTILKKSDIFFLTLWEPNYRKSWNAVGSFFVGNLTLCEISPVHFCSISDRFDTIRDRSKKLDSTQLWDILSFKIRYQTQAYVDDPRDGTPCISWHREPGFCTFPYRHLSVSSFCAWHTKHFKALSNETGVCTYIRVWLSEKNGRTILFSYLRHTPRLSFVLFSPRFDNSIILCYSRHIYCLTFSFHFLDCFVRKSPIFCS